MLVPLRGKTCIGAAPPLASFERRDRDKKNAMMPIKRSNATRPPTTPPIKATSAFDASAPPIVFDNASLVKVVPIFVTFASGVPIVVTSVPLFASIELVAVAGSTDTASYPPVSVVIDGVGASLAVTAWSVVVVMGRADVARIVAVVVVVVGVGFAWLVETLLVVVVMFRQRLFVFGWPIHSQLLAGGHVRQFVSSKSLSCRRHVLLDTIAFEGCVTVPVNRLRNKPRSTSEVGSGGIVPLRSLNCK